jgi:hypothetical protein
MAVNLSPYGGVGAQFLDNAGNVLTGGKIFTYAAGTTTNQVTYTTSAGNIPHSNPIILDASGRVPSGGEIWLTDGLSYKFILRDANDVLIATYDNVTGINSNFIAFTNQQEIQTATAGQTVFNFTTMTYSPGTNSLSVFVDGVNQYGPGAQYAYVETDADTVTFVNGLHVGAEVKFTTSQLNSSGLQANAFQVSYTPPFTGSVGTNVGDKLAQTVSVMDFGAVGDGVTDDTVAIQTALSASNNVEVPSGNYRIDGTIALGANKCLLLDNANLIRYSAFSASTDPVVRLQGSYASIEGTRNSVVQSQNASPKGVVAIYDPAYVANVAYGKISGFQIEGNQPLSGGDPTSTSSCVYAETGLEQGGTGVTYFNQITDLTLIKAGYGIHLTAQVNATQINNIIFGFLSRAAMNFEGNSNVNGEVYGNTVNNAWFTNASAPGTSMHRMRYARFNVFTNCIAEQGGGSLPTYVNGDATAIGNSWTGLSNVAGGSTGILPDTNNLFLLAATSFSTVKTWTPVIEGATVAGTNTYFTQNGIAIKLGRLTFIQFEVIINVKDPAMDGNLLITGLPFEPLGGVNIPAAGVAITRSGSYTLPAGYDQITAQTRGGTSQILISKIGSAVVPAGLLASEISNVFRLSGSAFYVNTALY